MHYCVLPPRSDPCIRALSSHADPPYRTLDQVPRTDPRSHQSQPKNSGPLWPDKSYKTAVSPIFMAFWAFSSCYTTKASGCLATPIYLIAQRSTWPSPCWLMRPRRPALLVLFLMIDICVVAVGLRLSRYHPQKLYRHVSGNATRIPGNFLAPVMGGVVLIVLVLALMVGLVAGFLAEMPKPVSTEPTAPSKRPLRQETRARLPV